MTSSTLISVGLFFCLTTGLKITPGESSSKGAFLLKNMPEGQKSTLARSFQSLCVFNELPASVDWASDLKSSVLTQSYNPNDTDQDVFIKRVFIERIVDEVSAKCKQEDLTKRPKQNEDIYEGVGEILTNVFSGNLFGIIQSSVGIRTPEGLSGALGNVMRQFLESLENAREAIGSQANRILPQGGNRRPGAGGAGGSRLPSAGAASSGAANALGSGTGANRVTQQVSQGAGNQISGIANNGQVAGTNYIQQQQQQYIPVANNQNIYQQQQAGIGHQQVVQGVQQQGNYIQQQQQLVQQQQQQIQGAQVNQIPQQSGINYNNVQQAASNFKGQVVYQIKV